MTTKQARAKPTPSGTSVLALRQQHLSMTSVLLLRQMLWKLGVLDEAKPHFSWKQFKNIATTYGPRAEPKGLR